MLCVHYESKKALKAAVGQPLRYTETSIFGREYRPDGSFTVAGRPHMSSVVKREFFAEITMADGRIVSVR